MRPVSLPKSGRISLAGNHLAGSGRLVRALALLLMPEANMTEGRYQVERGDLWLLENLCGFRVLVVLGGLYGSARNQACESNKADGHHVMATPPLMYRKGHAYPGDQ